MISGTEIAAARQRAGLSQKALADLLGTDIKTVNNWETGRTKPRQIEAVRQFVQMHPPEGVAPLSLVSDEELLKEIAERFARTQAKGDLGDGDNLDQKSDDDPNDGEGGTITELKPKKPAAPPAPTPVKRAAREGKSQGRAIRKELGKVGEESQVNPNDDGTGA